MSGWFQRLAATRATIIIAKINKISSTERSELENYSSVQIRPIGLAKYVELTELVKILQFTVGVILQSHRTYNSHKIRLYWMKCVIWIFKLQQASLRRSYEFWDQSIYLLVKFFTFYIYFALLWRTILLYCCNGWLLQAHVFPSILCAAYMEHIIKWINT